MLSHYTQVFDNVITDKEPFNCPICNIAHKKRRTLVQHFAITHNKIIEMTVSVICLTSTQLLTLRAVLRNWNRLMFLKHCWKTWS